MIGSVIEQVEKTLTTQGVDYRQIIDDFGQVRAYEARVAGKTFSLDEHIRGLVYAQLSNQRPWGPIAKSRSKIDAIFSNYSSEVLKRENPARLSSEIQNLRCGNRKIAAQMRSLGPNIEVFERIVSEFRSMDAFVVSKKPDKIAKEFASGRTYQLREIGFTLAMEYLRNVGINVIKPDLHICRIIGPDRLGFSDTVPSPEDAYECIMSMEREFTKSAVYIDNLLWIFAAQDYGNICSADPKCDICRVTMCAKNPHRIPEVKLP